MAWRLARSNYRVLLATVAVFMIPAAALASTAVYYAERQALKKGSTATVHGDFGLIVAVLAVELGGFLSQALVVNALLRVLVGEQADWRQSISLSRPRFVVALAASLLTCIFVIAGFAALFVPGFYLLFALYVIVPVSVLENLSVSETLKRAWSLTRGSWWRVFGTVLLTEVIVLVSSLLIEFIVASFTHASSLGQALASGLALFLVSPLLVSVAVVLYVDLRCRVDGLSLEGLASSLGIDVKTREIVGRPVDPAWPSLDTPEEIISTPYPASPDQVQYPPPIPGTAVGLGYLPNESERVGTEELLRGLDPPEEASRERQDPAPSTGRDETDHELDQ